MDLVRAELVDDPTVDITTTGRTTGLPRRIDVEDASARRVVLDHPSASWYRSQEPLEVLVDTAPLVEVVFDDRAD